MKKNVGSADRIIRVLLAVGLMTLYLLNIVSGTFGIAIVVVSAVLLLTSLIGSCPLYKVFGISTCPAKANLK